MSDSVKRFGLYLLFSCLSIAALAQDAGKEVDIAFESQSISMNSAARKEIDSLFSHKVINSRQYLLVYGYSDLVGGRAASERTSQLRASIVKNYLITKGMNEYNFLLCAGLGRIDSLPGYMAAFDSQQYYNKVEIIIEQIKKADLAINVLNKCPETDINNIPESSPMVMMPDTFVSQHSFDEKTVSVKLKNGDEYIGNLSKQLKKVNYGVYVWANGERYSGDFRNDKKEGHGFYKWKNGKIFEGEWKNDHPVSGKITLDLTNKFLLKVLADQDSRLILDGKYKGLLHAGNAFDLPLPKGRFKIKVVSISDSENVFSTQYIVKNTDGQDLMLVNLGKNHQDAVARPDNDTLHPASLLRQAQDDNRQAQDDNRQAQDDNRQAQDDKNDKNATQGKLTATDDFTKNLLGLNNVQDTVINVPQLKDMLKMPVPSNSAIFASNDIQPKDTAKKPDTTILAIVPPGSSTQPSQDTVRPGLPLVFENAVNTPEDTFSKSRLVAEKEPDLLLFNSPNSLSGSSATLWIDTSSPALNEATMPVSIKNADTASVTTLHVVAVEKQPTIDSPIRIEKEKEKKADKEKVEKRKNKVTVRIISQKVYAKNSVHDSVSGNSNTDISEKSIRDTLVANKRTIGEKEPTSLNITEIKMIPIQPAANFKWTKPYPAPKRTVEEQKRFAKKSAEKGKTARQTKPKNKKEPVHKKDAKSNGKSDKTRKTRGSNTDSDSAVQDQGVFDNSVFAGPLEEDQAFPELKDKKADSSVSPKKKPTNDKKKQPQKKPQVQKKHPGTVMTITMQREMTAIPTILQDTLRPKTDSSSYKKGVAVKTKKKVARPQKAPVNDGDNTNEVSFWNGTSEGNDESNATQISDYIVSSPFESHDTSSNMIFIEGGKYFMGCDECGFQTKPVHQIILKDFYISKYKVTVAEFRSFIEATHYRTTADQNGSSLICAQIIDSTGKIIMKNKKGVNWRYDIYGELLDPSHDQDPVLHVTWYDAQKYCEWKTKMTGKKYRLPTEAEWEYVARGGVKNPYKDDSSETAKAKQMADSNYFRSNNLLGVYKMSGDIWEWCSDWYDNTYYQMSPLYYPKGPGIGTMKVLRGGNWKQCAGFNRFSCRFFNYPEYCGAFIGFRIAKSE